MPVVPFKKKSDDQVLQKVQFVEEVLTNVLAHARTGLYFDDVPFRIDCAMEVLDELKLLAPSCTVIFDRLILYCAQLMLSFRDYPTVMAIVGDSLMMLYAVICGNKDIAEFTVQKILEEDSKQ